MKVKLSLMSEFKEFAIKGNMIDMAVGIIIGGAFGKIVSSLVGDVIMPPLGVLIGGVDFTDLAITLREASAAVDGEPAREAVVLSYGKFIQSVVDFLIIAFAIFLGVRAINTLRRKEEDAAPAPAEPEPTREEQLLAEIRDLLREGR